MSTADFVAIVTGKREYIPGEFAGDRVSPAADPPRQEFTDAARDRPRMTTADFVAIVTGQREYHPGEFAGDRVSPAAGHYHEEWPSADPFAAGALREYNYNPDEPRDEKGRWTTGGSASVWTKVLPTGDPGTPDKPPPGAAGKAHIPTDDELRREKEKALQGMMPTKPAPDDSTGKADANSAIFGKREFKSKDGKRTYHAQFVRFDDKGHALFRVDEFPEGLIPANPNGLREEDAKFVSDLEKLGQDEAFRAGLKAKPDNIHLDSHNVQGDKMKWEADVIRDIGMLSELPTGKQILDNAKTKGAEGKQITISPTDRDNYANGGDVHFDPGRTRGAQTQTGDRERPPFLGLGQELFNAEVNLSRGSPTTADKETGGLRTGRHLRSEYNATFDSPGRANDLRNKYPGWGTHKVDEKVLGLDGRPVPP
jgi:hypothetical protein